MSLVAKLKFASPSVSRPLACVQGVLQAHPLSAAAQTVVEGALGDMHGSLTESAYPDNANTLNQNSVSIGGMSLSIHGLSTRRSRCETRAGGPSNGMSDQNQGHGWSQARGPRFHFDPQ